MNNSLIGSDRKMVPWMQTNEPLPFDPALNILNLGEFITILLLHGTALLVIGLIVKQKSFSEISRPLLILLFNWFLCALFLIPYEFFLLITWESDSASKFGITLFFLGLPGFLLMSAIPISVMFVTLDRICITHFGAGYTEPFKKKMDYGYGFVLALGVGINLCGFFSIFVNGPILTRTDCYSFICLLQVANTVYFVWRSAFGLLNSVIGAVFFIQLYTSNKKFCDTYGCTRDKIRANRINNILTGSAVINEFMLSFLPHFIPLICEKIFIIPSDYWNMPFSEVANSLEAIIFVGIYSRVMASKRKRTMIRPAGNPGLVSGLQIKKKPLPFNNLNMKRETTTSSQAVLNIKRISSGIKKESFQTPFSLQKETTTNDTNSGRKFQRGISMPENAKFPVGKRLSGVSIKEVNESSAKEKNGDSKPKTKVSVILEPAKSQ